MYWYEFKKIELAFLASFTLVYQIIEYFLMIVPYSYFVMFTIQEVYEPMRGQVYLLNKSMFFNWISEIGLFVGFAFIFLLVLSGVIFLGWQAHKRIGCVVLRRVDKIYKEVTTNEV